MPRERLEQLQSLQVLRVQLVHLALPEHGHSGEVVRLLEADAREARQITEGRIAVRCF